MQCAELVDHIGLYSYLNYSLTQTCLLSLSADG